MWGPGRRPGQTLGQELTSLSLGAVPSLYLSGQMHDPGACHPSLYGSPCADRADLKHWREDCWGAGGWHFLLRPGASHPLCPQHWDLIVSGLGLGEGQVGTVCHQLSIRKAG